MAKLPFLISRADWETLVPRDTEQLGLDPDIDAEQQKYLAVFKKMDLRVCWACERVVFVNNLLVANTVVVLILVVVHYQAIADLLVKLTPFLR
jgi:hypothetical protein